MFCVKHFKNILEVDTCKMKHYKTFYDILQMFYFTRKHFRTHRIILKIVCVRT